MRTDAVLRSGVVCIRSKQTPRLAGSGHERGRVWTVQPVDFTRLLEAERLIGSIKSDVHKTEAVKIVLQSMSFASPFTPAEQNKDAKEAAA